MGCSVACRGATTDRRRRFFAESTGLSASSVGRAFVARTAALLKDFKARRFDDQTFAVLLLDGKYLAGMQMIIAMGITTEGEKVVLGHRGVSHC